MLYCYIFAPEGRRAHHWAAEGRHGNATASNAAANIIHA